MPVVALSTGSPIIDRSAFLAPDSWVTGQVTIGKHCSLFFGAVARGDIHPITIGDETNIQEQVTLHTSHGLGPCIIGRRVTVGHHAIAHGCIIEDECIIGMGAIILDGAVVGKHSIIGAQSMIPKNMKIPERSLVVGVPAKIVRSITDSEHDSILASAASYIRISQELKAALPSRAN